MKTSVFFRSMQKDTNPKASVVKGGSVTTTSTTINEVTSAVDAVSDVIKVINGIAAETHLIAMNAAIKAAHSGEYGESFSVVVDEVRKLAESTAKNSRTISLSLENIINQLQAA